MAGTLEDQTAEAHGHREVEVSVNRSRVRLEHRRVTGLQLKEAAIAQGVEIQPDFQLWRIDGDGKRHQIGDEQEIDLHDGERFAANAPDDNS
jgi:hypothetical protein